MVSSNAIFITRSTNGLRTGVWTLVTQGVVGYITIFTSTDYILSFLNNSECVHTANAKTESSDNF